MEDSINEFDIDKEVAIRAKESGTKIKTLPSLYEVIDDRVHLY